jgi:hypothetical protein
MEPVDIEFYSGARADETPRAFVWKGERLAVERLVEERLIQGPDGIRERRFKVMVEGGRLFTLAYRQGQGYVLQEEV